jgi:hypothetical protein
MTFTEHIDYFMNIKLHNLFDYTTEYTIKFFKKKNEGKLQNSILLNIEDRTVRDMRIEDPEVFKRIVDTFGDKDQEEVDKKVALKGLINIHEFVENIIDKDEDAIIGFISHMKWEDNERMPGSQVLNYTIH